MGGGGECTKVKSKRKPPTEGWPQEALEETSQPSDKCEPASVRSPELGQGPPETTRNGQADPSLENCVD